MKEIYWDQRFQYISFDKLKMSYSFIWGVKIYDEKESTKSYEGGRKKPS